jgi:hypothetical protein
MESPAFRSAGARTVPIARLLGYYAVVTAVAVLLALVIPDAAPAPTPAAISRGEARDILEHSATTVLTAATNWRAVLWRSGGALAAMLWALAMALPVAWTLTHTRRLRYDPSLVQTLIILPIVVAGIVLVVKNSLALAFALAGIVAGVRFRQKLDEPEQAVYVLLALGIGLAAGVQSQDVALAMSLVFTIVVLTFWRFDIGDIFSGGRGALLAIGDSRLLEVSKTDEKRVKTELDAAVAAGMKPTGLLIVRATDPDAARRGLEKVLPRMAKHWRFGQAVASTGFGPARIEIPLELKDKRDPSELIAELEARMSGDLSAAEYIPFGNQDDLD